MIFLAISYKSITFIRFLDDNIFHFYGDFVKLPPSERHCGELLLSLL